MQTSASVPQIQTEHSDSNDPGLLLKTANFREFRSRGLLFVNVLGTIRNVEEIGVVK